jgi:hypothetical protein
MKDLVAHLHFPPCLIGRVIVDQQNNCELKRTEGHKRSLTVSPAGRGDLHIET